MESEQLESQRLRERLATSEAQRSALQDELTQKKAENAHLLTQLNEARA